jgi:hypothetical protein
MTTAHANISSRPPPPPASSLPARDGPGFWIPDEVVDDHAELLGCQGVFLYVCLARRTTRANYPTALGDPRSV